MSHQPRIPRGIRNNNPGNIRKSSAQWLGEIDNGKDEAFEVFAKPEDGIRAMGRILLNYQRKRMLRTVAQIISRWAPPSENDTHAYEQAIADALGVGVNDPIDLEQFDTLFALVMAITLHENGRQPYVAKTINAGIAAAYGKALNSTA